MNDKSDKPVSYVVAVSGGVDSMVLLHILARSVPADRLTVAHFDHGIRPDSAEDRLLVSRVARDYGLSFVYDEGRLGAGASEAAARDARYTFLRRVMRADGADYIVTAHHEDDVLETAVINLLRGTGRKGLASLRSHGELYRPLLSTPKRHILAYAAKHGLEWREDSTNADVNYLRNYVRHVILPRFDHDDRDRLRHLITDTERKNVEIDGLLAGQLHLQPAGDRLDRHWFRELPDNVAREIVAAWLRRLGIHGFDRKTVNRLAEAIRTLANGKRSDINGRYVLLVGRDHVTVAPRQ